jgi:hypothetical protein
LNPRLESDNSKVLIIPKLNPVSIIAGLLLLHKHNKLTAISNKYKEKLFKHFRYLILLISDEYEINPKILLEKYIELNSN